MTQLQTPALASTTQGTWSNLLSEEIDLRLPQDEHHNVGDIERYASIAGGAMLTLLGISRRSVPALLGAGAGLALLYRGASGHCPLYGALGMSTADQSQQDGIHVEQTFIIDRSPEDLYGFWHNFENLPTIMRHLKSVSTTDQRRSHWVAKAPRIAGGEVEWDAEITHDEPNSLIAWRSLPGSEVDHAGAIRFARAPGERGTEVHVFMNYRPPGGRLGHWVAKLFGEAPDSTIREDLRNFKRLMETGELPTITGQPRGTCTGQGRYEGE